MSASAAPLLMSAGQREALEKIARSLTAAHREVRRAKVLLDAADGVANSVIAARHGVTSVSVRAWRAAFDEHGLADWGKVAPGRGRKASIPAETIARIVELTTTKKPKGHTHWSCRTMAAQVGVSPATVQRIWSELGLQPHRVDSFKVSNDPRLRTSSSTSSGSTSTRRPGLLCCAWTRKARFKHWTEPRRHCR